MPKLSAGILMYRIGSSGVDVFLVHPGGPFWAKKDLGSWSIPKGEYEPDEDVIEVAKREFKEETGFTVDGDFSELGSLKQPSGKIITAFMIAGDVDANAIQSNTFRMEWPPKSGREQEFPEVDRASWFPIDDARKYITVGQLNFISKCELLLRDKGLFVERKKGDPEIKGPLGQQSLFD